MIIIHKLKQYHFVSVSLNEGKKRLKEFLDLFIQGTLIPYANEFKLDYDSLKVSFGLICLTFGREDVDSQGGASTGGITAYTPTFSHPYLSAKKIQELNVDAIENISTCTGTTMGGDMNK